MNGKKKKKRSGSRIAFETSKIYIQGPHMNAEGKQEGGGNRSAGGRFNCKQVQRTMLLLLFIFDIVF